MDKWLAEARQRHHGVFYSHSRREIRAIWRTLFYDGFTCPPPGLATTPDGIRWAVYYSRPLSPTEQLATTHRLRELAWVRRNMEEEHLPPWLIEMVLAQW